MSRERIIKGRGYHDVGHLESPWWRGFNDAYYGREYDNIYSLLTAKYDYQQGYAAGAAKRSADAQPEND